jgi:hypothetical protein
MVPSLDRFFDGGKSAFPQDGQTELLSHLNADIVFIAFIPFEFPAVKLLIKDVITDSSMKKATILRGKRVE